MSPMQEVFNALTMLPTALVSVYVLLASRDGGFNVGDLVIAAAILLHLPFSMIYHVHCAAHHGLVDPVENNRFLKLDLIFIHIAGAIMSFATSQSLAWFLTMAAFNGVSAYR